MKSMGGSLRCNSRASKDLAEVILSSSDENYIFSKYISIKKYIFKA